MASGNPVLSQCPHFIGSGVHIVGATTHTHVCRHTDLPSALSTLSSVTMASVLVALETEYVPRRDEGGVLIGVSSTAGDTGIPISASLSCIVWTKE